MVKTHVETELSEHLFLLAGGGVVIDGWNPSSPRGCRPGDGGTWPPAPPPLPLVHRHCLVLPAESLTHTCIPHSLSHPLSPILPSSVCVLMMLRTVGINCVCGSGRKGKMRKLLCTCSREHLALVSTISRAMET